MPYRLLRFGFSKSYNEPRMFLEPKELRDSYDLVIIGAGAHGLATAYYLARDHQLTNIAVIEKGYMGQGGTGRNTGIIRSNYLTEEGVRFHKEAHKLFQGLSEELDLNLFYSERGHFTLAHTGAALRTMRWRAEVNKHFGIDSYVITPEEIHKLCPYIDLSCGGHFPITGALYHPPGAVIRHDAVAWGYARKAGRQGVELHQQTEATGLDIRNGEIKGVQTNRGFIRTNRVLSAVAGWSPNILSMAGLRTPITVYPLQACVTEPTKPWLDQIVVSASLHVYLNQSARGELVMGTNMDPYELHSHRSSLEFLEMLSGHFLDLFPFLSGLKVMRQWTGRADITPDWSSLMGTTPIKGFYIDAGWGTWGFKATTVCGTTLAYTIANDKDHDLIQPFHMSRFRDFNLVGEKGAASVGH